MFTEIPTKGAEIEQLLDLKERYELAIAGSKDGIWDWDLERDTVYVSDQWKSMLGYEPHELQDTKALFKSLLHPEDKENTLAILDRFINNENAEYEVVFRMRHKSGDYITISSKAMAKRNMAGKATRIAGSHTDITETKKHQDQLKEKSLIAEISHEGIAMLDKEGKVQWANGSYLKLMEIPEDRLLGKRPCDLFESTDNTFREKLISKNLSNYTLEAELITYRKKKKWVNRANYVMNDDEGVPLEQIVVINDITKRKKSETRLRELSIVAEKARNGVLIADVDGCVIWANDSFLKIGEIPLQELIGKRPTDLFNMRKEDTPDQNELIVGSSYSKEFEIKTYTNKRKWVTLDNSVYEDENGDIRQIEIVSDITERKLAEDKLKKSNKRLERILYDIGELSIVLSKEDNTIITCYDSSADIERQLPEDEILGLEFEKLDIPILTKKSISEAVEKTKQSGKKQKDEYFLDLPSGREWYSLITSLISFENKSDEIIVTIENISEKKRYQIELEETTSILNETEFSTKTGGWALDLSTGKIKLSDEVYDIFDEGKDITINIHAGLQYFSHEDRYHIKTGVFNCIKSRELFDKTMKITSGSGTIKWIRYRVWAGNENGKVTKVFGSIQDITASKDADEALKVALKKAKIANEAKSEFLANMSHEIRTPLNGVIGFTDLLLDSQMDNTQKEYVQTVHRSANSLLDIINDILDFSKIEAGKVELHLERADVFEIGSEVVDIVKFPVQKKGLELLLSIPATLPKYIWVDIVRLRQVLVNLLGNAVKFTEVGEVELSVIKIDEGQNDNAVYRFSVRDTGIGIGEENKKKIFEAFSQEDASTTKRFGGTGLGLTISNKLLSLMGSKLQLDSMVGLGSTFYFDLELRTEEEEIKLVNQQIKENLLIETSRPITKELKDLEFTVLLAEDNNVNRLLAKVVLNIIAPKARLIEAVNGEDAVTQFVQNKIDIVLMDVQMPIMNGYETSQKIREIEAGKSHCPIIAVTAGTVKGEREKCIAAGMDDYISKPFVKETVEKVIRDFLNIVPSDNDSQRNGKQLHINYDQLNKNVEHNSVFLNAFFPHVKDSLRENLNELQDCNNKKDFEMVNIIAHRIKGVAMSACFDILIELCAELEYLEEYSQAKCKNLIDKIEIEIKILLNML